MSLFPGTTPRSPRQRRPVPPGAARTRVERHRFTPDDTVPPDHRNRHTCSSCHLLGEEGDVRHFGVDEPVQEYPEQDPETRREELRRLGEREDD